MKVYIVISSYNDNNILGCFSSETKATIFKHMCDKSSVIKEYETLDDETIVPLINIRIIYDFNWIKNPFAPSYTCKYENRNSYINPQNIPYNWIFYENFETFDHIYINLVLSVKYQVEKVIPFLREFVENLAKEITELKISGCEKREIEPFVDQKFKEFINQKLGE